MLSGIDLYRHAYDHEIWADRAMLKMLGQVAASNQTSDLYQRALNIAYHIMACRHNHLQVISGITSPMLPWFVSDARYAGLSALFDTTHVAWTTFLSEATDSTVEGSFTFDDNGETWRMSTEAQLFQLIGHAAYHRGQVVLLIDQLGGETFDTDYIEWFTTNFPDRWGTA